MSPASSTTTSPCCSSNAAAEAPRLGGVGRPASDARPRGCGHNDSWVTARWWRWGGWDERCRTAAAVGLRVAKIPSGLPWRCAEFGDTERNGPVVFFACFPCLRSPGAVGCSAGGGVGAVGCREGSGATLRTSSASCRTRALWDTRESSSRVGKGMTPLATCASRVARTGLVV